jgi:predicted PilT family ATPase
MKKIALIALLTASISGYAQQGTLGFQKGQKLEMVTEIKKTTSLELGGMPIESKLNATLTEIYDVKDVSASGSAIEHKVKRFVFNAEGMQGNQSFDSEKEGDMKGDIGKYLEKSIKNKYTVNLDPTGKVASVKLDDDNPNMKNDTAEAIVSMLSMQTGLNLAVPQNGSVSAFSILPSKAAKKGDSWTDTSSNQGQKRKVVYTVNSLTDNEIILDYTEEVKTDNKMDMMGQEAIITATQKSTGKVTLDKKSGILKQRTADISSEGNIEVAGQSIPMNEKSTMTITVK